MVSASSVGVRRVPAVLLTGFEAFGGSDINPSWQAVQALDREVIGGHRVIAAQLPTVFDCCLDVLGQLLEVHRPALVLCTGQAGGRAALSLERVAINVDDARIADNGGAQPVDMPVIAAGPAAYFSSLPIKAMRAAVEAAGIRAEVSQTAGTFVCNHVFYGLMHELAIRPEHAGVRGGFMHVPWLPEQGRPSMAIQDIAQGLRIAIECALATQTDLRLQAGALN
jgi:pyroglutamyl-peptidase